MPHQITSILAIHISNAMAHSHAADISAAYCALAARRGNIGAMIEHTIDECAHDAAYDACMTAAFMTGQSFSSLPVQVAA